MAEKPKKINIERITNWIQDEKCILILGPDVVFDFQKSLYNELYQYLLDNDIDCKFDNYDELFSSASYNDVLFTDEVANFFKKLKPSTIYQQIAEIPFHTIISLTPDLLLKQTFDNNHFDYNFSYYHKEVGCKIEENTKPNQQKPLLYNYLGVYNQHSSLVLCFNDFFSYLSSILGGYKLNNTIREQLMEAKYLLFLGIKFDKWYSKLILQLLNFGKSNLKQASFIETGDETNEIQNFVIDFYKNELKIDFIQQNGNEIIDLLHNYYKQNGGLRQPKKETQTASQITNIINVNDSKDVTILQNVDSSNINLTQNK